MKLTTYLPLFVFCILYLVFGVTSVSATNKLYFIHQDHLNSTSIVTDASGGVVNKETYFPYGSTRTESGNQSTERGYTGQVSDVEQTGLYYYNARYYNPLIAKFTQADITNNGLNRYAYVSNNPIIYTDPNGHQGCDVSDYYCRYKERVPMPPNVPIWYEKALQGDYLELPPMGFRSPEEMFQFGKDYGLPLLFMRGEEGMRFQSVYNPGFSLHGNFPPLFSTPSDEYYEESFNKRVEELLALHPDLSISTFDFQRRNPGRKGVYWMYDQEIEVATNVYSTFQSALQGGNWKFSLETLEHEYTHYLNYGGSELKDYNQVDTEINAHFTETQLPWVSSYHRRRAQEHVNRFEELRAGGLSDAVIGLKYQSGNLLEGSSDNKHCVLKIFCW